MLNQEELNGKWENWVTNIQEYDLDVKPDKIVKGQGICRLVMESLDEMHI